MRMLRTTVEQLATLAVWDIERLAKYDFVFWGGKMALLDNGVSVYETNEVLVVWDEQ